MPSAERCGCANESLIKAECSSTSLLSFSIRSGLIYFSLNLFTPGVCLQTQNRLVITEIFSIFSRNLTSSAHRARNSQLIGKHFVCLYNGVQAFHEVDEAFAF